MFPTRGSHPAVLSSPPVFLLKRVPLNTFCIVFPPPTRQLNGFVKRFGSQLKPLVTHVREVKDNLRAQMPLAPHLAQDPASKAQAEKRLLLAMDAQGLAYGAATLEKLQSGGPDAG